MIKWVNTILLLIIFSSVHVLAQSNTSKKILFTSATKRLSTNGTYSKTEKIYWGEKSWLYTTSNYNYDEAVKDSMVKFPKASFYPPGSIAIPDDKRQQAIEIYKPLIDSIFSKAKELKKTFVEITTLGYSDFTPKLSDMIVYDSMCRFSNKTYLAQDEFEKLVSYHRANQISDILVQLIYERLKSFDEVERIYFHIISEGKGTDIPDKKRVYKDIDEGRRKVVIYRRITELL